VHDITAKTFTYRRSDQAMPDIASVYVYCPGDNPPQPIRTSVLRGHSSVYAVAFSPDGTRVVSGSEDRTLRLWDSSSGAHLESFHGNPFSAVQVARPLSANYGPSLPTNPSANDFDWTVGFVMASGFLL
jgi:WD40 repeat protein